MKEEKKRLSRKAAVCIVLAIAAILLLMVVISSIDRNAANGKVRDVEEAAAYLQTLGWEVDTETVQIQDTALPQYFDKTMDAYNELQIEQGFDLKEQAGKAITVYTFHVTNYPYSTDEVYACLMTCKSRVIGGDIHSAAIDGFMHALQ